MNVRAVAATLLCPVINQEKSLSDCFPFHPQNHQQTLSAKDQALLQEICFGVCRWYPRLDTLYRAMVSKPLKRKDGDIHALLIVGLYQLLFMRIPSHAAVSETADAARQLQRAWAVKLVNGVLRRYLREQQQLAEKYQPQESWRYAHPEWLLACIRTNWPKQWQAICDANNERAPMCLRVNQRRYSRVDYLAMLDQEGIAARPCQWSGQGIQLAAPSPVSHLPGFESGAVSVQDEAAQLSAKLLQLAPGQRVLDTCAAPGGKTCHILEQQPDLEEVVAVEIDSSRMTRVAENLRRLGLNARLVEGDAMQPDGWWDGRHFDRILLDAPCSATGVIRRHPDIKLLRRRGDIDKLADQQIALLTAIWPLLKPGGLLLYATCSILERENEQVILRFREQQQDVELQTIEAGWGVRKNAGRYLLPTVNGHDGFYYAQLYKK